MASSNYDAVIIGAGAAGLMCAATAGKSNKKVALIDHNKTPGKKILISGGGRCNFTNIKTGHEYYQSENKHFFKSALKNYTPDDFIELVKSYDIEFYEKTLGQLFCRKSASEILNLLIKECQKAQVEMIYGEKNISVEHDGTMFKISNENITLMTPKVVIATGGLSIPQIGASDFGHKVAKKFGHKIIPTRPALVPFKSQGFSHLAGVSTLAEIKINKKVYKENILFTHKGFSGPAILKASLFWKSGETLLINWVPDQNLEQIMKNESLTLGALFKNNLPKKLSDSFLDQHNLSSQQRISEISKKNRLKLLETIHRFKLTPLGTEGFNKAEVTAGGVDTSFVCSQSMESKLRKGLYFIGEVLDVTGQLGGYNFQWAWASGSLAGKSI
ncbi:MAG: NAD(P)/FAD-dependent oxidoreductase [Bdellovibrionota bacterium]|nr:NAD(P)/FAD-dependent oxidoreductase [Bdellovibrionota bacterium]